MTADHTHPFFSAENISFSYGKKSVLHQLSFSVAKGSCTAILGNNGCGKTTLLTILAGARKPDAGQLNLNGTRLGSPGCRFADVIGYVPQENPLLEELSGLDNLRLRFHGSAKELTRRLSLPEYEQLDILSFLRLPVRKLSGGMKRRLSLACAFLNQPDLLILDEPCSALDFSMKAQMHACLASYLKQGGTILLSTHEEGDLALCDTLLLLRERALHSIDASLRGDALQAFF